MLPQRSSCVEAGARMQDVTLMLLAEVSWLTARQESLLHGVACFRTNAPAAITQQLPLSLLNRIGAAQCKAVFWT